MNTQELKTVGFRDMHPDQLEALMKIVGHALILANNAGEGIYEQVYEDANDLAQLFGAAGIELETHCALTY